MSETIVRSEVAPRKFHTEIGVVRCFGRGDIGRTGLVHGWAEPEDAHNWNDGPEAVLDLATAAPDFPCTLVIEGTPLILPERPWQTITLYANGLRAGFWRLAAHRVETLEVTLEPSVWRVRDGQAAVRLAFELGNSLRLSTLDPAGDNRELGFCFRTLALFPEPYER